jgi:glycerophosphoryl diester phosphodiesterase
LPVSADNLLNDSPYLAGVAPDRVEHGGGVLRLSMLLELVADAGRDVRLLIETKHPTRYGGLVEATLVEELRRFGWAGKQGPTEDLRVPADMDNRVVVMSFATIALRRVRLLAPEIPTVKLLERLKPKHRTGRMPTGVQIAGPGLHLLKQDPDFVDRAHARGHPVYTWTVDEPRDVEFVRDLGVDTIITDHPAAVRKILDDD